MASLPNGTADGAPSPPERQPWWELLYRWLGWSGGLALLAVALSDLRSDFGPGHLGLFLFHLGLAVAGLLLLLTWVIELFEWYSGRRLLGLRRWLVPLLVAAPLLMLASGLVWLLGY